MCLKINGSITLSSLLSIGLSLGQEWGREEEQANSYSHAFAVCGTVGTAGVDISSGGSSFLVATQLWHPTLSSCSFTKGRAGVSSCLESFSDLHLYFQSACRDVQRTTAAVHLHLMKISRRQVLRVSNRNTKQLGCPSEGGYHEEQSWVVIRA